MDKASIKMRKKNKNITKLRVVTTREFREEDISLLIKNVRTGFPWLDPDTLIVKRCVTYECVDEEGLKIITTVSLDGD